MTIQDTIPKWVRPWTLKHNQHRAEEKLNKIGEIEIFIDQYYTFSSFGPYENDRYYFRIKLKQKP